MSINAYLVNTYLAEVFPEGPSLQDLIHTHAQLHLANVNFLMDYPRLLAPDTKYVGGLHLKKFKDVQEHLDEVSVLQIQFGKSGLLGRLYRDFFPS